MPAIQPARTPEELARLGAEIYDNRISPTLRLADENKYVAIDVVTGDFEVDEDDYSAVMRLRERNPASDVWLGRVSQPTTYR